MTAGIDKDLLSLEKITPYTEANKEREKELDEMISGLRANTGTGKDARLKNELDALEFKKGAVSDKERALDKNYSEEIRAKARLRAIAKWNAYLEELRI